MPQGTSLYFPKSESGGLNTRIYDPVIKSREHQNYSLIHCELPQVSSLKTKMT